MRRYGIIIVALLMLSTLSGYAGWMRANGKTTWINGQTPATCFARERWSKDIYPLKFVQVFADTPYLVYGDRVSGSNVVNCGYCTIDASGDVSPRDGLYAAMTNQLEDIGALVDCELAIDSNGDVYPKD